MQRRSANFRAGMLLLLLVVQLAGAGPAFGQEKATTDRLQKIAYGNGPDTARVRALLLLGRQYDRHDNVRKYGYAGEALNLARSAGWKYGEMRAERLIAECFAEVTLFPDAIVHFNRCLALAAETGDESTTRACMQYLVHCHDKNGNKPLALRYQKDLTDRYARTGDRLEYCHQRWAYANLLIESGRADEGLAVMRRTVALAGMYFSGRQKNSIVAEQLNNLGRMFSGLGKPDSALLVLHTALDTLRAIGDTIQRTYVSASICNVYVETGADKDSLLKYAEQTVRYAASINDTWALRYYSPILADAYAGRNVLAKAWRYHRLGDSLAAAMDKTPETLEEATKLARLNLQQQIEKGRLEKNASARTTRFQRILLGVSLLALLLLTVLLLYIYRSLRARSRTARFIARQAAHLLEQNKMIEEALKEKEILLKESHHRVKNNLQLISSLMELQLSEARSNGTPPDLRAMQQRVHSIALVHSRLIGEHDSAVVAFPAFVKDLFDGLNIAFSDRERPVRFTGSLPEVSFGIDTLVPLGLILNELMTNSFKYAFRSGSEGIIRVNLMPQPGGYTLRYSDNGPGLPAGRFDAEGHSLGLYLVRRLSRQLKGSAEYAFDNGSNFTITFRHEGD